MPELGSAIPAYDVPTPAELHDHMREYLLQHSSLESGEWGMPQFWTLEEELEVVRDMKSQDCRDRIEETGDDSWNKLYLYGNVRFGNRPCLIPEYQQQLEDLPDTEENFEMRHLIQLRLAREMLTAGDNEGAIRELHLLCLESIDEAVSCLDEAATSRYAGVLRDLLAFSYFRLAETENCIANHNYDSCLFPLKGHAVHKLPRGATNAIKVITQQLRIHPGDLGNKYLLNLAYMALGQWPDNVPAVYLIPPETFQSEYDIGRFYDISSALGVGIRGLAGGAVMADFDKNGFQDLMSSGSGARDQLGIDFNNGDGTFSSDPKDANIDGFLNGIGMSITDYNNDGFPDPIVIRGGWHFNWWNLPNSLLHNNGDGTFTDVTQSAGVWDLNASHSWDWADFNNDGYLDGFLATEIDFGPGAPPFKKQPCKLFMNNKNGTFTDIAVDVGLAECPWTKSASWGDYNNDNLPDLFFSNYDAPVEGPQTNQLFRNDGPVLNEAGEEVSWKFTDVSAEAGIAAPKFGFTSWFFDYNNDGWEDILIVGFSTVDIWKVYEILDDRKAKKIPSVGDRTVLYHNNGDGTFTDVSADMNFESVLNTMGANFGDLDNDGFQDIFFGTGAPDLRTLQRNRVYRNDNGKSFQDVTDSGGFGHLQKGHGISFGDIDNDGDQDILVNLGAMYSGDHFTDALYLNPGHGNHFLTIRPVGVQTNKLGIGARIKVTVATPSFEGGVRDIYLRVGPGGTFGSNSLQAEMGLGDATEILNLQITWPVSGFVSAIKNVPLDSVVQVTEGSNNFELLDVTVLDFTPLINKMEDAQLRGEKLTSCGCGHD